MVVHAGACRLDMVILSEVIKSSDTWSYPYNALRNQALARAGSDVSTWMPCISLSLHTYLEVPKSALKAKKLDD